MALASRDDLCFVALSLVCMSIYLPVGHVFLGMEGAKAVRQCHVFVWSFGAFFSPCLVLFCKCQIRLTSFFRDTVLDDRQCSHARSASRTKKELHMV